MYALRIFITTSMLVNVILGGRTGQTFSARNWEWKRQGKPNLVFFIDGICILLDNLIRSYSERFCRRQIYCVTLNQHCMRSWVWWRLGKNMLSEFDEIMFQEQKLQEKKETLGFERAQRM